MTAVPEQWYLWIYASVRKFFVDQIGTDLMHVEGEPRKTSSEDEYFELRIDGPIIAEHAKNDFQIFVEINILIMTRMSDHDVFKHAKMVGKCVAFFGSVIDLYKLGDPNDDPTNTGASLNACLRIKHDLEEKRGDHLAVRNFGQIDKSTELVQTSVEAHYTGHLSS